MTFFGDTQSQTEALGGSAVVQEWGLLPDGSGETIGRARGPHAIFSGGAVMNRALLLIVVLLLTCSPIHAFDDY